MVRPLAAAAALAAAFLAGCQRHPSPTPPVLEWASPEPDEVIRLADGRWWAVQKTQPDKLLEWRSGKWVELRDISHLVMEIRPRPSGGAWLLARQQRDSTLRMVLYHLPSDAGALEALPSLPEGFLGSYPRMDWAEDAEGRIYISTHGFTVLRLDPGASAWTVAF